MNLLKKSTLLKSVMSLFAASVFISSVAYAAAPVNPFTVINQSGASVSYNYTDGLVPPLTHSGTIPNGQSAQPFLNISNLASGKTDLSITDTATGKTTYCSVNGNDYYYPLNHPTTLVEYPTINGTWSPYVPGGPDQPFVATHADPGGYSNLVLNTGVIQNNGSMTILSANQCVFALNPIQSELILAPQSGAIIPSNSSTDIVQGIDPVPFDMSSLFSDKVPSAQTNPTPDPSKPEDFVGLMIQPDATTPLPNGFALVPDPKATYTAWNLTIPNTISTSPLRLTFNACDTNLTITGSSDPQGNLYPGVLGFCTTGTKTPDPAYDAVATLTVNLLSGVLAKSPDAIVSDYKADDPENTQPLLVTDVAITSSKPLQPAVNLAHVDQLFEESSGVSSVTYTVASNDDPVPNRNDGATPWLSTITEAGPNTGKNWGPILLQNDQPGLALDAASFTVSGTGTSSNLSFAPDGHDANLIAQSLNTTKGAIIQLTIHAHTTTAGVTNPDAYQTIYLVLRTDPNYTILDKNHVQAWVYPPNDVAAGNDPDPTIDNPNALFKNSDAKDYQVTSTSVCNYTTTSPGRLEHYVKTLNDSWPTDGSSDKYGISEITPDIGWIDAYQGNWFDTSGNPGITDLYAETPSNPQAGCLASYFKYNAAQAGHPLKFLITEEFGSDLAGIIATGNLQPWQTQLVIKMLAVDANQMEWNIYQGSPHNYFTPPNNAPLIDGIQFDVEPFKNNETAHVIYKGIADLLAREGKINEIYAFADSDNPALIESQGPMGKFLLSSYDVASNTPSTPANPLHSEYNGGNTPGFWGNGNPIGDTTDPSPGTQPTYAGLPWVDPSSTNAQDFACHYNSKGPDTNYMSNSWCSANLATLVFGNVIKFNGEYKSGSDTFDFETMNEKFDGHFMLSVPSEGSATSWAYDLQFSPRTTADSLDAGKHYVVPVIPNTYQPHYVPLDFGYGVQMGTSSGGKVSLVQAIQGYIVAHGYPQPGTYDVFFNQNDVPSATTCSWALAPVVGYPYCVAILLSHENGAADSDFALTSKDPTDIGALIDTDTLASTTPTPSYLPAAYDDLNMLNSDPNNGQNYVANELQVLYDQANTTAASPPPTEIIPYAPTTALGTPATNSHNVGVAMFAISDISVENKNMPGLMNQGSVGTSDPTKLPALNKGVQFPVSFDGRSEQVNGDKNIWTLTDNYLNGITGQIQGGDAPPPPPPASPTVTTSFVSDTSENFTIKNTPSEGCSISTTYPDGTQGPSLSVTKDEIYPLNGFADPINYTANDTNYTWSLRCGSDISLSGKFARYGDKVELCVTGASLTSPECQVFDESATTTKTHQFTALPNGTYTITTEPASLNNMNATDPNNLLKVVVGSSSVVVNGADVPLALSFQQG